jgi:hypothetical protein
MSSVKRNFDELVADMTTDELDSLEAAIARTRVKREEAVPSGKKRTEIEVPCRLYVNTRQEYNLDERSEVDLDDWPDFPQKLWWLNPDTLESDSIGQPDRTDDWNTDTPYEYRSEGTVQVRIDFVPFPPTTEGGVGYHAEDDEVWIFFKHEDRFYPFRPPLPLSVTWQKLKEAWLKDPSQKVVEGCEYIHGDHENGWSYEDLFTDHFIPIPDHAIESEKP